MAGFNTGDSELDHDEPAYWEHVSIDHEE